MTDKQSLVRPPKLAEAAIAPVPELDPADADDASVALSHYRTGLSNHRTNLSEHRTQLSEYRTDLSTHRTELSTDRTEMSKRRTGMSFQRTRMSADRTLMSVIRTSLSLISFGFTIAQVFEKLHQANAVASSHAARNFGIALILLGIVMLALGIAYHGRFMLGLRRTRQDMAADELIHAESEFPPSFTLVTAVLLLGIGIVAVSSMVFRIGPFG
jgi:uncharacterized membrane protein YidH (DUF202 family)